MVAIGIMEFEIERSFVEDRVLSRAQSVVMSKAIALPMPWEVWIQKFLLKDYAAAFVLSTRETLYIQ